MIDEERLKPRHGIEDCSVCFIEWFDADSWVTLCIVPPNHRRFSCVIGLGEAEKRQDEPTYTR